MDYQELVDYPSETLSSEYKDWLDLGDHLARANTARHIAAISNGGGGFLVFGFTDEMVPSGTNPLNQVAYDRDAFSSITRKYLEPAVQCDVVTVTSSAGQTHAVVVIPAHGAVPVCAKYNGPEMEGRIRGIVRGTYYLRKVGPESAPIVNEAEWLPLIRRCTMHDRSALLAALDGVLKGAAQIPEETNRLSRWHQSARTAFDGAAASENVAALVRSANTQFSYAIVTENQQYLAPETLRDLARQLNFEIRDRVNTGWSMFYPFDRQPIDAYLQTDATAGLGDIEFLEANLLANDRPVTDNADFWRISPTGMATLIRPFRFDFYSSPPPNWRPGAWFSPNYACREVAELLRHAQAFSERFDAATQLEVRCEWRGLNGRILADPQADWGHPKFARSESRVSSGVWPIANLPSGWPQIAAELVAPVIRAFDPRSNVTAEWIQHESTRWRPLGQSYP